MTTSRAAGGHRAERYAENAKDQPALRWTARIGFVCYGLVYLLIGWLSGQLALGRPTHPASGDGAMAQLVQEPLGHVLVWLVAIGFAALVVWEACQAIGGHRDQEGLRRTGGRLMSAGRGLVFGALGFAAATTAMNGSSGGSGGSGGSSGQQAGYTARLLGQPFGAVLVGAVGIALIAFAIGSMYGGVAGTWRKQIDVEGRTGTSGVVITWLARVGYLARGVAFGVMGGFVVWAAISHDPQRSRGLDQALQTLRQAPAGTGLLLAVAAGLACFGIFNATKVIFLRDV